MKHLTHTCSAISLFLAFLFFQNSLPAQVLYDSLDLENDGPLTFFPDPRLLLEKEASIEIGFYIDQSEIERTIPWWKRCAIMKNDTFGQKCLLAIADEDTTRVAIMLNQSLTRIGFYDGSEFASVPFNFRRKGFFHVVFSTKGQQTQVFINQKLEATLDIGYNKSRALLPLHIGTSDGLIHRFRGSIWTLRLWDKALSSEEVKNKTLYSPADEVEDDLKDHVIGYGYFTQRTKTFYYSEYTFDSSPLFGLPGYEVKGQLFPENGRLTGIMLDQGETNIRDLVFLYESKEGDQMVSQPFAPTGVRPEEETHLLSVQFAREEKFVGIAGTYDTSGFVSIRIITDKGVKPLLPDEDAVGPYDFLYELLPGESLKGYLAEIRDDTLVGLSLYTGPDPEPEEAYSVGLFFNAQENNPVKADSKVREHHPQYQDPRDNLLHTHGNYTSCPIYDVFFDPGDLSYSFIGETFLDDKTFRTQVSDTITFEFEREDYWRSRNMRLEKIDPYTFNITSLTGTNELNPGIYTESSIDYSNEDSKDKITWGGTFAFEQRPPLLIYNFKGYNIARMDYKNYQLNTGAAKSVFQYPDENSLDYYFGNSGKILPHGLLFKNDRDAFDKARTQVISSMAEHQRAWNMNLGISIGIPDAASFGFNASFRQSTDRMRSSQKTHAVSVGQEILYAVVVDKTNIYLDDDFVAMIELLRKKYLATGDPIIDTRGASRLADYYNILFETFGTHYPYAVSYGGCAIQDITLSKRDQQITKEEGTEISANASATMEEASGSISAGGGNSSKDVDGDGQEDDYSSIETIGGSISFSSDHPGWGLPDRSEVPVLLDLRPIYELLSPVFFEDEIVYKDVREGLEKAYDLYMDSLKATEGSWLAKPKVYELYFDEITISNISNAPINLLGILQIKTANVMDGSGKSIVFHQGKGTSTPNDIKRGIVTIEPGSSYTFPIDDFGIHAEVYEDEYCGGVIEVKMNFMDSPLNQGDFDYLETGGNLAKIAVGQKLLGFGFNSLPEAFGPVLNGTQDQWAKQKLNLFSAETTTSFSSLQTGNELVPFDMTLSDSSGRKAVLKYKGRLREVNPDKEDDWTADCNQ